MRVVTKYHAHMVMIFLNHPTLYLEVSTSKSHHKHKSHCYDEKLDPMSIILNTNNVWEVAAICGLYVC